MKCRVLQLSTFICIINLNYCSFLGGTISWIQDNYTDAVRFTYRLTWEKGTGPCGIFCSPAQIGTQKLGDINSSALSSLKWMYSDGYNFSSLSGVNYHVTSVNILNTTTLAWEQGENSFDGKSVSSNRYTVYLSNIPWIQSVSEQSPAKGYLETTVDLRTRNDTGKPNNSPFASVPPFIGVAFGCATHIQLPVADPDGDILRCRWADVTECRGACTNPPKNAVRLRKASCLITINAYNETGFLDDSIYRLAVVVEDFPQGAIDVAGVIFTRNRALSKIPLQFTLRTASAKSNCNNQNFKFVYGTPKSNYRFIISPKDIEKMYTSRTFYLQTDHINFTDMMVSSPRFFQYSYKSDTYYKRNDTIQLTVTCRPKLHLSSENQICVWGLEESGVTTDSRCIREIISNTINCSNNTCHNHGICMNLYNTTNDVCNCSEGFKSPYCLEEKTCNDEPCANNGTCFKHWSKYMYSCACTAGYHGTDCELENNHCAQTPCKNNGTCLDLQDRYLCLCPNNYSGKACETNIHAQRQSPRLNQSSSSKGNIPAWIPAVSSVGGLLVLVGLSVCIYKVRPNHTVGVNNIREPVKNMTENVKIEKRVTKPGIKLNSQDEK